MKELKSVLAIFSLAFAARLVYLEQISTNPFFSHPIVDAKMYDELALQIAGGNLLGSGVFNQAPLYAYFLGLIYRVFGHDYFLARLVQISLGAVNCCLIYAVGRTVFSTRVGFIAGLIAALYGTLIFYDAELLRPLLVIFLSLASLLAVQKAADNPSARHWFVAGLLLGLTAITWETILLFIPVVLVWLYFSAKGGRKLFPFLSHGAVMCLAVILVILPVTIRNYRVAGDLVLISAWGGLNFYLGNNPEADRLTMIQPGEEWDELVDLPARAAGITRPSLRSRWFYEEAFRFIREAPLTWLGQMGKKLVLFWNAAEVEPNNDLAFYRNQSALFGFLYQPSWRIIVPFGVVAPLALMGMVLSSLKEGKARLLLLFALTAMIALVLYHVRARYRMPAVPALIVFAAWTVDYFYSGLKGAWRWRTAAAHLCVFGVLTALVNADFFSIRSAASFPLHTTLGKIYLGGGDLDRAREEFRKAIAADPKDHDAHVNLGVILERTGRGDEALASFQNAIQAKSDYAIAHNDVGVWYFARGMVDPAIAALQLAVSIKPPYAAAHYNLGIAYLRKGLFDQAAAEFRVTLSLDPQHAEARSAYERAMKAK